MSNAKKKSFMLFKDLKGTVDDLDDTETANLFRAILQYQNEGDIDSFDKWTKLLMKPIILQFERDDEKWEAITNRNRVNGAKGGRPRNPVGSLGTQNNPDEPKKPDTVTVTDTDTVTVTKKKRGIVFNYPDNLKSEEFKKKWILYIDYRKQAKIKTLIQKSVDAQLKKLSGFGEKIATQAIDETIANGWQGLFPEKIPNNTQTNGTGYGSGTSKVNRNHGTRNEGKGHLYAGVKRGSAGGTISMF